MTGPNNDERAEFIEHAKWLLEWHNKRGEAFTTRAVALLGFKGEPADPKPPAGTHSKRP